MRISVIFKSLAALLVLSVFALLFFGLDWARSHYYEPELNRQETLLGLQAAELPDVEPGDRAFQRAAELLATGQLEDAKEKLHFIINFSPGSAAASEARRILGEIYLDEIFAPGENAWKVKHTVTRGEFPLNIAKKYETTLDCMMVINNLHRLQLHPGDELYLVALNFNLRIDLKRQALTVRRQISEDPRRDEFVKEYAIERFRLPSQEKAVIKTSVKDKKGMVGTQSVTTSADSYRESQKIIWLNHKGWQIRAVPEMADELPEGNGFFLKRADIEELALLLRVGNEVEILMDKNEQ
ncbi:LysM peptidoglycan-binding domain-containing protein [Roseibacillus ishigakijimensis]|uniref:LysM peptidoglycan-binding domain-containing protein n=1 Tax=Roseibacillus ishigakijimensis TaxID=454146 RepID=A0A934RR96_9BACT|nr:LysM peptidoglycan-binding domain-containing protein [Roseibacillus ishigakijimensis]MBK1833998.1 LysM peptidoglycan-binding domain-containing protein [Roseibacillus ishigakijimensis]